MYTIDWKQVREQIQEISELVEENDDVEIVEDVTFKVCDKKYQFTGWIEVCNKPVYTQGSYWNDFRDLELRDFFAEDEDLEEYLENYTFDELERKIA